MSSNQPDLESASDSQVASSPDALTGRRIFIVEDDPFIALALEEILAEHGLIVFGVARTIDAAMRLAADETINLALLDVNVGAERIDAVADLLASRGCPFVFTTGCGRAGLPEKHADRVIVEKPFYIDEIIKALRDEVTAGSRSR
jgi:DNA-binding response OmpR family regulator